MPRVDLVCDVGLVVRDVEPARPEQISRTPGEADIHDRIGASVRHEHARVASRECRLPARDDRYESREREDPCRRAPVLSEPERIAHDRAHRESAQHRARGCNARASPELVVEGRELVVRAVERLGIGVADPRHDVPVESGPAWELERRPGSDDVKPVLGIEHVGEREQVVLVGAPAVVQHEQTCRLAVGGSLSIRQRQSTETTSTGCSRPFSDSARDSDNRNEPPTPSSVSTLTRISAALAAPPIRAATWTSCPP